MDLAYEHMIYADNDRAKTPTPNTSKDNTGTTGDGSDATPSSTAHERQPLQAEFQETFKAFSASPWGTKLGGFWGNVRKQGESYYEGARKQAEVGGQEAYKGIAGWTSTLTQRTRGLSGATNTMTGTEKDADGSKVIDEVTVHTKGVERKTTEQKTDEKDLKTDGEGQDANSDAALQANETFIARFKSEAAKRLQEIQKAEDAADEALLRFGTNVRNFLRDAVSLAPPESAGHSRNGSSDILFESKSSSGKRVIHTTRFDAQLHVVHTSLTSFTEDPLGSGDEWISFKNGFDIEKKTDEIAEDLEKYEDLRSAMDKLVPEQVAYKDFWTRYYFLRHVIESQEEKRKEMLKASTKEAEEEVGWDEDSDDDGREQHTHSTANAGTDKGESTTPPRTHKASDSVSTLHPQPSTNSKITPDAEPSPEIAVGTDDTLKPSDQTGRRSHDEKSVADSDASYDLVSGATSRAPGSPRETKANKIDESDEEDWE